MNTKIRLSVLALSLAVPFTALAAAPANVTGVTAKATDGKVMVSWTASISNDVAYYRVYFSRASILENGGEYDDFEATKDKTTSLALTSIPANTKTLYVAVMAVNAGGEESSYFTEEAKVTLGAASATSTMNIGSAASSVMTSGAAVSSVATSSAAKSSATPMITTVTLVSSQAISSTGVLLTFSAPVKIAADAGRTAFTIKNGSGEVLDITKIVILGNLVTLWTKPQEKDRGYTLEVSDGVKSAETGMTMAESISGTFTGHSTGVSASNTSSVAPTAGAVADVTNINLHAQAQTDGTYTVTVDWRMQSTVGITGFEIQQSRNGGATLSAVQAVAADATSVRFQRVPAGSFGVMIHTVGTNGKSKGAFGSIVLPKTTPVTTPTTTTPHGTELPESGPLTWMVFLLAGAVSGAIETRRRMGLKLFS
jgi:hypothetical protein